MSKILVRIAIPIILIIGIYALGPEPDAPVWDPEMLTVPSTADELEQYVAANEAKHKLKPDNEARIIWADSTRTRTAFSVVYIHGYSASQEEGDPVHETFAKTFGCNLYLARMADHGVDTTEQLLYFNAERWWKSSREALAIGKALGEKVIIMSTSTGGTMGLVLASFYPDDVHALINMSPNIEINQPLAWMLNKPWGLYISRAYVGGKSRQNPNTVEHKYWNTEYRMESAVQLQELVADRMTTKTFSKVTCPTLNLYYYKNETEQDPTVKVSAILSMHQQLATPDSLKVAVNIPNAGGHVLGSHVVSKDIESVHKAVFEFATGKLRMRPVVSEYR